MRLICASICAIFLLLIGCTSDMEPQQARDGAYIYNFDGKNLLVSYLDDDGSEYVYWMKKCLANDIFTFYKVGWRDYPQNLKTQNLDFENTCVINYAFSDNIGPINISSGGWSGGNHTYKNKSTGKEYRTASSRVKYILADGVMINSRWSGSADHISFAVETEIYDTSLPESNDGTSLTAPYCKETDIYTIYKNNIEVSVELNFAPETTARIECYNGMQSNFEGETHILTPNGKFTDWKPANDSRFCSFTKRDYPDFNRFIEKRDFDSAYQASYIWPEDLGNHESIYEGSNIFERNSFKCYHRLIQSANTSIAGESLKWSGTYTFFHRPIADDDCILAYIGSIRGSDALFINTKKACSSEVLIPSNLTDRKFEVIEDTGIDIVRDQFLQKSLKVESTSPASLILIIN